MQSSEVVILARDVDALLVPHGTEVRLPEGAFVTLTQSLGGAYTVVVNGNMLRIDGADADALGRQREVMTYETPADGSVNMTDLDRTLATIFDPEIPVSILDLGLIYKKEVHTDADDGFNTVYIEMTLTAPGCGMGPVLVEEVKRRVKRVPNVGSVDVELVFDPPWDRHMMTEEAQLQLGVY
ncbi:MAG: putative Fe-S cluster assembly protein SufT [Gammaproteobacteria bacterium]|nr:putative Fe-S cluster assembly protein SufT [Gammaproteobacteria bacterium]